MKKASIFTLILVFLIWLPSCYKNYYDIPETTLEAINSVSFANDVVPIMTSGACGCHNNNTTRQIPFSYYDSISKGIVILYDAILIRDSLLYAMAIGGPHPGEGSIFFTPSQATIVRKWYEQGSKDDSSPPAPSSQVTYTKDIVPLVKTQCNGSACHGGNAKTLDYTVLKASEPTIVKMMNTLGADGHPGGSVPISEKTASAFLSWIAQGYKL
jgi:hypothetical protein